MGRVDTGQDVTQNAKNIVAKHLPAASFVQHVLMLPD
jgi:hypothetical protein